MPRIKLAGRSRHALKNVLQCGESFVELDSVPIKNSQPKPGRGEARLQFESFQIFCFGARIVRFSRRVSANKRWARVDSGLSLTD
jgi:hypothetical protein